MIEELRKLLETHAHLRGFPQFKNLKADIERRLQELEDRLAPKPQPAAKAIPATEPETQFTSDTPEIDRRV